jgi:hypothetical protein
MFHTKAQRHEEVGTMRRSRFRIPACDFEGRCAAESFLLCAFVPSCEPIQTPMMQSKLPPLQKMP